MARPENPSLGHRPARGRAGEAERLEPGCRQSCLREAVALLAVLLTLLPAAAIAQPKDPPAPLPGPEAEAGVMDWMAMGADAVVVRPLGFAAFAVGAVLFVPAALVSAPEGMDGIREAWERFVTGPAQSVFTRPLGEF